MSGPAESAQGGQKYVLITAAYNEETYIAGIIESVVSQTVRPEKWVIASDGSIDHTDEIVRHYAEKYAFIHLLRIEKNHVRNFAAQVNGLNAACGQLKDIPYDFIGNLDADISLQPSYFGRLLEKFISDPRLGLAGGFICEKQGGKFVSRRGNSVRSVPHAIQLFRRECYESIGGYVPLRYGGPDWHAEVVARMKGWRVESFPELRVFHHRPTGTASGLLRNWFRQGRMEFTLGSHPLFVILKCFRRFSQKPVVAGALTRLAGFGWSYCRGEKRLVSEEFIRFLRSEQKERMWPSFLRHPVESSHSPAHVYRDR